MDEHTPHLIRVAEEWRRLTRIATVNEVEEICKHYHRQVLNDLMTWRETHQRHILGISR